MLFYFAFSQTKIIFRYATKSSIGKNNFDIFIIIYLYLISIER